MVKSLHPIGEISSSIALESERRVRLECRTEAVTVDDSRRLDAAQATIDALAQPLEFPPLSAAIVPGDRVAIAVDEAVPRAANIVHGVVESLCGAGIDSEAISIVTRDAETSQICRTELAKQGQSSVKFIVHDPDDEKELCLVGVTQRHGPLVVNRAIFDADVVLPIGCARLDDAGVYDSLFPRFSNTETIQRFRAPLAVNTETSHAERVRETDEAGWLIGAPLVIEVVPGADETVAHVIAGESQAVAQRAEELTRQQWISHSDQRVSLVIAAITGGAPAQNWNNVGRALAAAEQLVADDGAIAVCSNLDEPPGESLGRLIGSTDLADTERRLRQEHSDDSWAAWQLARALDRGPVYFLSQLDAETVEDMGMAPVADVEELSRLAGRQASYIVLDDAQHAVPSVAGEDE